MRGSVLVLVGLCGGWILAGCQSPASQPVEATKQTPKPANPTEPKAETKAAPVVPASVKTPGYEYYGFAQDKPMLYVVERDGKLVGESTQLIKLKEVKDGKAYFTIVRDGAMADSGHSEDQVYAADNGIYVETSSEGKFDKPTMDLPADMTGGTTWPMKATLTTSAGEFKFDATMKIEGETSVTVPAGTFKITRVTLHGTMETKGNKQQVDGDSLYAQGIGLVKQTITSSAGSKKTTMVVSLKKKPA